MSIKPKINGPAGKMKKMPQLNDVGDSIPRLLDDVVQDYSQQ